MQARHVEAGAAGRLDNTAESARVPGLRQSRLGQREARCGSNDAVEDFGIALGERHAFLPSLGTADEIVIARFLSIVLAHQPKAGVGAALERRVAVVAARGRIGTEHHRSAAQRVVVAGVVVAGVLAQHRVTPFDGGVVGAIQLAGGVADVAVAAATTLEQETVVPVRWQPQTETHGVTLAVSLARRRLGDQFAVGRQFGHARAALLQADFLGLTLGVIDGLPHAEGGGRRRLVAHRQAALLEAGAEGRRGGDGAQAGKQHRGGMRALFVSNEAACHVVIPM